tara:strand:+ start:1224 stop:1451 length:228 start_codon:yes stop_codon:yes gene_type:complete
MNLNKTSTYIVKEEKYELAINYNYYYNTGTHDNPPEAEMDITSVYLNGMNITEFYWNYVDDAIHTQVWEHAQENN